MTMNALDQFIANCAKSQAMADKISAAAEDHFGTNPEKITWADVGDTERIIHQLAEILESMNQ